MKVVLCVRVELRETRVTLAGPNNMPIEQASFETRRRPYKDNVAEIRSMAARLEAETNSTIVAACVTVAGTVNDNVVTGSSTIPSWIGKNPHSDLQNLNVPMMVCAKNELDSLGKMAAAAWELVQSP